MEVKSCKIAGCGKPAHRKGYCAAHYTRMKRHGDPHKTLRTPPGETSEWIKGLLKGDLPETCVEWPFGCGGDGYGIMRVDGQVVRAARYILSKHTGVRLDSPLHVAHKPVVCHNTKCVNPSHLRWATVAENVRDQTADGTKTRGTTVPGCKLDEAKVREIRRSDLSAEEAAAKFSVSKWTIYSVRSKRNWKHV